jgi:branched-chain amino acid transport system substrate-binding protein
MRLPANTIRAHRIPRSRSDRPNPSGPASAYSAGGKVQLGYFEKLNSERGVNGRKIKLISLDDAFTAPKTVEQTRKLVEQEEVLLVFNSNGTAANSAVQKYLNAKKVPQLFGSSGASKFADPKNFHWTMDWLPTYYSEARVGQRSCDERMARLYAEVLSGWGPHRLV